MTQSRSRVNLRLAEAKAWWDSAVGMSSDPKTSVGVLVASCGRPDELGQLLDRLDRQTLPPSRVVLSVVEPGDLPPGAADRAMVLIGLKGSCAQRNRGLDMLAGQCDLLFICDDDYLPSDRALERMAGLFEAFPDIVGANAD